MKVLVIGSGAREHALCWALTRSASVDHVVCAPGNAGISETTEVMDVALENPDAVTDLARRVGADLVVVGPEAPLVAGVVDALTVAGISAFGPTAAAARLEGSKAFAKEVMNAAGVPTAGYWAGDDPDQAVRALDDYAAPYVVKADGLAAGKGVRICGDRAEAVQAINAALVDQAFGEAGSSLVIEEFLDGPEYTLLGLSDGRTVLPMEPAQDYKRAHDGDTGLNTGGMGAYSPVPAVTADDVEDLRRRVLQPVIDEMAARGTPFVGVLYAGLALTAEGPKVIEFNARFGDPETQVVLPRLQTDLGEVLLACAEGDAGRVGALAFSDSACVTVVLASGGYPGSYQTGRPITGLPLTAGEGTTVVFHAGTAREEHTLVTAGGRVLSVSAVAETIEAARTTAYDALATIDFEGAHHRTDIAANPTVSA